MSSGDEVHDANGRPTSHAIATLQRVHARNDREREERRDDEQAEESARLNRHQDADRGQQPDDDDLAQRCPHEVVDPLRGLRLRVLAVVRPTAEPPWRRPWERRRRRRRASGAGDSSVTFAAFRCGLGRDLGVLAEREGPDDADDAEDRQRDANQDREGQRHEPGPHEHRDTGKYREDAERDAKTRGCGSCRIRRSP